MAMVHMPPDDIKGRRKRAGGPKPKAMASDMQKMMDAADACGMDCTSASMDHDSMDGAPTLRMTLKKRKGAKRGKGKTPAY